MKNMDCGPLIRDRFRRFGMISIAALAEWAAQYFKLGRVSSIRQPAGGATVKSDVNFLAAVRLQSFDARSYLEAADFDHSASIAYANSLTVATDAVLVLGEIP